MPCWVVPSLAAEVWGVSRVLVLQCIADGTLAMRIEMGFVVVDAVDPAQRAEVIRRSQGHFRKSTFTVFEKLEPQTGARHAAESEPLPSIPLQDEHEEEPVDPPEVTEWERMRSDQQHSPDISQWREVRRRAAPPAVRLPGHW